MSSVQQKRDRTQLNSMVTEIARQQGGQSSEVNVLRAQVEALVDALQEDLGDAQDDIDNLATGKADKTEAIVNITQSGGVFTATRADGTTFTF